MAEETNNKMDQLLAKAMTDEAFKSKLIEQPIETLKGEGVVTPAGLEIKVLQNTDKVFHLVLPAKSSELSDDALDKVAGGIECSAYPDFARGKAFR